MLVSKNEWKHLGKMEYSLLDDGYNRNENCDQIVEEIAREIVICEICGETVTNKSSLVNHKKWKHEIDNPNHQCIICNRSFTKKYNLLRHSNTCVKRNKKQNNRFKSKCALCQFTAINNAAVVEHYQTEHKIEIVNNHLEFKTPQEFTSWKEEFESTTKSQFVQNCGIRQTKNGIQITKYVCHRDGHFQPKSKNIRHIKVFGSNKINSHCPATICTYVSDECVKVDYVDVHVGHQFELERLNISKSEKAVIAEKLALNIPFQQILDDIYYDSVVNNERHRIHLLKRKDLWNIVDTYNLKRKAILHKNDDAVNNTILTEDTSTETCLPDCSKSNVIVNELSKNCEYSFEERKTNVLEDFLKAFNDIQNEEQLQAVVKQIAPLESIVNDLSTEDIYLPEISNIGSPNKKIKSEILFTRD